MLEVTAAEYIEGYKVRVHFNDGTAGVADLADALWGPMFEPLKDIATFQRFAVSDISRTLCWENGADLAPEFLREKITEQSHPTHAPAPVR